jgi:RNA polymerase sigma factor (sigma-70 family)
VKKEYDLACDVLQEVFLKLYLCLSKLDTQQPIKPWLFQVARHRCVDELRRRRVTYFSELEMDEAIPKRGLAQQDCLSQQDQEEMPSRKEPLQRRDSSFAPVLEWSPKPPE